MSESISRNGTMALSARWETETILSDWPMIKVILRDRLCIFVLIHRAADEIIMAFPSNLDSTILFWYTSNRTAIVMWISLRFHFLVFLTSILFKIYLSFQDNLTDFFLHKYILFQILCPVRILTILVSIYLDFNSIWISIPPNSFESVCRLLNVRSLKKSRQSSVIFHAPPTPGPSFFLFVSFLTHILAFGSSNTLSDTCRGCSRLVLLLIYRKCKGRSKSHNLSRCLTCLRSCETFIVISTLSICLTT